MYTNRLVMPFVSYLNRSIYARQPGIWLHVLFQVDNARNVQEAFQDGATAAVIL